MRFPPKIYPSVTKEDIVDDLHSDHDLENSMNSPEDTFCSPPINRNISSKQA